MRMCNAMRILAGGLALGLLSPRTTMADSGPQPATQGQRLAALCAGPRRAVESMLNEYRGRPAGSCPVDIKYAELNMKSVEEHCAELERNKELSPGRYFRDVVSAEFVSDVERAVKEVRGFLTCAVGERVGAQEAYIKRLIASPVAWGNFERTRCLGEKLKKLDSIRDSTALEVLDREVLACVAPTAGSRAPSAPPWATALTVTGGVLLAGAVPVLVWGASASCVHQANGYCVDSEVARVNQRRYVAYASVPFSVVGATLLTVGVAAFAKAGSSENIAVTLGPRYFGLRGLF